MKKLGTLYIFFCSHALEKEAAFLPASSAVLDIHAIPMACSSMVKDLFLLKAFEAGADAVTVWVCPEGACRHVEGNLRARKRVERVKAILDDIGLSARRLTFFNIAPENSAAPADFLEKIASTLQGIGKNPAGKPNIPVSQRSQNAHALA